MKGIFSILFAYFVGLVLVASAGEVHSLFLVWANWILGVLFVVSASYAGWQLARE